MATKKKVEVSKPRGRTSTYNPIVCKQVTELMKEGASIKELSYYLNVNRDTIYQWIEKYADFADTIKKGVDDAEAWWMIHGRTHIGDKEFNSTLWYMNMKNRFGWRDKTETTGTMTIKHEDALDELK